MKSNYLKLFANCKIVIGNKRSTICDLQRNKFILIPNSLANLFDVNDVLDLKEILKNIDKESHEILNDYLELLNKNELIFPCTKKEILKFPVLNLEFDFPATISNMILDYDRNSKHNFKFILDNYNIPLNCRYIQLRFFDEIEYSELIKIIELINQSFVRTVDLILKEKMIIDDDFIQWVLKNRKIRSITIHSSKNTKIIHEGLDGFGIIVTTKQNISSNNHCGIISHNLFNIAIESFTESQHHNSCLNRKLSIDANGNIKNCPSMSQSFGNIKDTSLEEALNHPDFKKHWNVTKDQIEACKDCEFRHICTDCRAYTERTTFDGDIDLSKPLKCGYNPYTNEWSEWSTNPLKEKAIEYYGLQDLVKIK